MRRASDATAASLRRARRLALALAFLAPVACGQSAPEVQFTDSSLGTLRVTTLARGLDHPWALCFLPDGRALVTERPGRLRIFDPVRRTLSAPLTGVPSVWIGGQGGLHDVVLDPDYRRNRRIWLSYSEGGGTSGRAGTTVARARLDGMVLREVEVMFRQEPKLSAGNHFGSRLVFDPDGYLFIALGENNERITAQKLDHLQGKVVRLRVDGSIPDDNPFVQDNRVRAEIWSYGHRNPQGAALNPWTGKLWTVEHGPQGGDEINIPVAGRNYGWPVITHGINYDGQPIPESVGTSKPGMEQPLHYWVPSIAPSGMAFYNSGTMRAWRGDVFVGALAAGLLVRVDLDGDRVIGEERLLEEIGWRIRDVRNGPGGALYLLTDTPDGRIVKVEPAKRPPPGQIPDDSIPVPKPRPVRAR